MSKQRKASGQNPKAAYNQPAPSPARTTVSTADGVTATPISQSAWTLRDDGTIDSQPAISNPQLVFRDPDRNIFVYHGNSLEFLDVIAAKYPQGRFDMIFADPPYFLSNGGITCHAGRMVKVDKGDWDKSRGPDLNHEFNLSWLERCQRVLKPNGTIWVSGTHHVIFSIGYAMQQLGFKILNDIAWEKPNPPPNLSCRYFTHSTETIIWAAKNEKTKHTFNYDEMRVVTGKQMKTVWRDIEGRARRSARAAGRDDAGIRDQRCHRSICSDSASSFNFCSSRREEAPTYPANEEDQSLLTSAATNSIWTLTSPPPSEKLLGKHPTQKPIALLERIILASTNEGDTVLDPFLGAGTTAVASVRLNRNFIGIELDLQHAALAARRADREIVHLVLQSLRIRIEISVHAENDLDLFSNLIDRSAQMSEKPEVQAEQIYHETKFVFLSCARVSEASVVHTTVDLSLQEAWAKTPCGKKRETTHIVRCETEIFRIES